MTQSCIGHWQLPVIQEQQEGEPLALPVLVAAGNFQWSCLHQLRDQQHLWRCCALQVACGDEVLKRMTVVDDLQQALNDTIGTAIHHMHAPCQQQAAKAAEPVIWFVA
jgi:hypothetical protein